MITKALRVYIGDAEDGKQVLLENKNDNTAVLFQSDVCADLTFEEVSTIKKHCERLTDVYASFGVLILFNEKRLYVQNENGEKELRYLGLVSGCTSVGKINNVEVFCVTEVQFVELANDYPLEKTNACKRFLTQGTFFFGIDENENNYDITANMQQRFSSGIKTDHRFLWFVSLICGCVSIATLYCGSQKARAAILSRVSAERAGARFQVRGVDDEGRVANFVETEQIVALGNKMSTFTQIRGSVPLFWEQTGFQVGSHKITITRGYELTQVAYDKHMSILKSRYGLIMILNLLSNKPDTDEGHLSMQYQSHHDDSIHDDVLMRNFDYHSSCKGGKTDAINTLYKDIETFVGYCGVWKLTDVETNGVQEGILRTNCLDCIDRTNSVQMFISRKMLYHQLEHIAAIGQIEKFTSALEKCWLNNANLVSRVYCGTGALKTANGKMSMLTDATRSVKRTIKNNFLDEDRQGAIEELLMYPSKPLPPIISTSERFLPKSFINNLLEESREFCEKVPIRVSVGTWNSNGGKILRDDQDQLRDWLLDAPAVARMQDSHVLCPDLLALTQDTDVPDLGEKTLSLGYVRGKEAADSNPADVIVIGLQELVDLTAGNIVSSSDIFIDEVKTGMKGKAGNKGGVGISFNMYATSICFVCAHLAAGQNNVTDRNNHFKQITDKMLFDNGMELEDHDYVFWCGDFNYRIDYENYEIRDLIKKKAWYDLQCGDQLTVQKNDNKVFVGFHEGPLLFPPTYKYDLNSDYYDTSEKFRAPAWCDRVLWKCKERFKYTDNIDPGRLIFYGNTEIKSSDHRPVLAVIDIEARKVDEARKANIYPKVLRGLGPPNPTVCIRYSPIPNSPAIDFSTFLDEILNQMQRLGEVILVRVPAGVLHITFKSASSALTAMQLDGTQVAGHDLDITLESDTSDWEKLLQSDPLKVSFAITPIKNLIETCQEESTYETELQESRPSDPSDGGSDEEENEPYEPTILNRLPSTSMPTRSAPSRPPPPESYVSATSATNQTPAPSGQGKKEAPKRPPRPTAAPVHSSGLPPRPAPFQEHEYAPILPVGQTKKDEYADYREGVTPSPTPPSRPSRPSRPDSRNKSYFLKKGQSAKEFLIDKVKPKTESETVIGQPYGLVKHSQLHQFDDGTCKISLDDGSVIVCSKGGEPVVCTSVQDSTIPTASRPQEPPKRPQRPVRPPNPSIARAPDSYVPGPCLDAPDDIFSGEVDFMSAENPTYAPSQHPPTVIRSMTLESQAELVFTTPSPIYANVQEDPGNTPPTGPPSRPPRPSRPSRRP